MWKLIKGLFILLLPLSIVWFLMVIVKNNGSVPTTVSSYNAKSWFSQLNEIEFPNLLTELNSLSDYWINFARNNLSTLDLSNSIVVGSFKLSIFNLLTNIWKLIYNTSIILISPLGFILTSIQVLTQWLIDIFIYVVDVFKFVFYPLLY